MNRCFCTRRNPISIFAATIYLVCQLEDKRKTQTKICKVIGLTEVTLREIYKELLENWDDLLPSNYNPVVPPEKAFPMATIPSGRSLTSRNDLVEVPSSDKDKHSEVKYTKYKTGEEKRVDTDARGASSSPSSVHFPNPLALAAGVIPWPCQPPTTSSHSHPIQFVQEAKGASNVVDKGSSKQIANDKASPNQTYHPPMDGSIRSTSSSWDDLSSNFDRSNSSLNFS
ncbi:plant-specific TFIIB-related 1 [Olea europaea subsp. europaea]|uniref:Plant-specific TFIIB-related 1 n=1 Tax=Olea europaea subsp. europaea TaxID=158383 RepID=A0A8S0UZD4_OLEEU|nr:plant-specific TFIIB-related 1 [Olea europaea subsp. europaea]